MLCIMHKSYVIVQVLHKLDSTGLDCGFACPCPHLFQHKDLHGNKVGNEILLHYNCTFYPHFKFFLLKIYCSQSLFVHNEIKEHFQEHSQ